MEYLVTNVVVCSFDAAANMKRHYNGLQAQLMKENPNTIYTQCIAHVLNLVGGRFYSELTPGWNLIWFGGGDSLFPQWVL